MFETRNDLSADSRGSVIRLLNVRLADAIDLGMRTKHAHWNVKGPHFIALHGLFAEIAEHIAEHVDVIAERTTTLGSTAGATVAAVARATTLEAYPDDIVEGLAHVESLAAALGDFGRQARAGIEEATGLGDADTADLFAEVSRQIDRRLWLLEAHPHVERRSPSPALLRRGGRLPLQSV